MRLAFCLNYYFPYGGLQRDFMQIAERARDRGHEIDVYVMEWDGDFPYGIKLHFIPVTGWTNHGKCLDFIKKLQPILKRKQFDLVIGFNKMPGLDCYYAADPCFQAKHTGTFFLKKLLPRYQYYLNSERSVFNQDAKTHILSISKQQKALYQDLYQTPEERFHQLPPPLHPSRKPKDADREQASDLRKTLAKSKQNVLLIVASSFHTKGVDRVIHAVNHLSDRLKEESVLWVVGGDDPQKMNTLVEQFNLTDTVKFLGSRDDMVACYLAADLMVHPARTENTGTVLLEAMLAGCPVITTANCGFANYITEAKAGKVLPEPFDQVVLNEALTNTLEGNEKELKDWSAAALTYSKQADLFSMADKALEVIEHVAKAA